MADNLPHVSATTAEIPTLAFERRCGNVTSALVIWLLSSLLVAWFEFSIFWDLPLLLFAMNLNAYDQTLVVWSLWARILLVTFPAVAFIIWSHWKGGHRTIRAAGWMWCAFVLTWLIIDAGLQCVTGASLWHYVDKAMVTEDWSLGGDVSTITQGVQEALWITGVRIAFLFLVCHLTFLAIARSRFRHRLHTLMTSVAVFCVVAITGIVGAREFVQQRPALEQLYGTIAFPAWLFHPDRIAEYGTAAFGIECTEEFSDVAVDLHRLTRVSGASAETIGVRGAENHKQEPIRTAALNHSGLLNDVSSDVAGRPNIVVLFTESIRHDAFCAKHTPRLEAWKDRALVANQHFTNSNCSELGAFACMYSQFPLCYDDTLNQQIPSAPCTQLKELGYQRQLIASCSVNFSRMNEFLGPLNFDRTSIHSQRGNPWHDNDKQTLAEIADVVTKAETPQFVFSILMATHYSYDYPPHYDVNPPACVPPIPANPTNAQRLQDRYFKALAFLDEQFDEFLNRVSGTNTIVVITGDHGESFLDDGFLCHGTRLSDIQSRTPLWLFGPGVPTEQLRYSSSHVDLMPTLLHLATGEQQAIPHSHGQSLLTVKKNRNQLLTQAHTNSWDVLFISDAGRLGMKVPRSGNSAAVMGFFDSNGRVDLSQRKPATEIPTWKTRIQTTIRRNNSP